MTPIRIAAIGDIHDSWDDRDNDILHQLGVDLVLFVGDFGNESIEVVQRIAALDLPKAVVLGNHDAWYTATEWGRRKCPYDRSQEDRFRQQLDLLGDDRVGYGVRDYPDLSLSVVGGRPCSWGGSEWKYRSFYREWFEVESFEASSDRIFSAIERAQERTVLVLGHNGPFGLGNDPEDPCGRDWKPIGGDYGDPDLAQAIARSRDTDKVLPLVTFGHMHHRLRHTRARGRRCLHRDEFGTLYLNVACVPRKIGEGEDVRRNFSLISLEGDRVTQAELVWTDDRARILSTASYFNDAVQTQLPV